MLKAPVRRLAFSKNGVPRKNAFFFRPWPEHYEMLGKLLTKSSILVKSQEAKPLIIKLRRIKLVDIERPFGRSGGVTRIKLRFKPRKVKAYDEYKMYAVKF